MYSKEQLEHSDFILKAMSENGGRMEKSDLAGLLDDKYGYAIEPHLQLEQLIITEGMIEREDAWLFLTKRGEKAAKSGFSKYLKRQDRWERLKDNADIAALGASVVAITDVLLRLLGLL